jgi:hypothetical protein
MFCRILNLPKVGIVCTTNFSASKAMRALWMTPSLTFRFYHKTKSTFFFSMILPPCCCCRCCCCPPSLMRRAAARRLQQLLTAAYFLETIQKQRVGCAIFIKAITYAQAVDILQVVRGGSGQVLARRFHWANGGGAVCLPPLAIHSFAQFARLYIENTIF